MENKKIQDKVTVLKAITSGDLQTKLSIPFMGLGVFLKGQKIKGCLIFLLEVAFFLYMATSGIHALSLLPSLGDEAQGKVWNEAKQIFEYTAGDNSQLILLFGVVALFVIAGFILLWVLQIKHAYKLQLKKANNEHINSFKEDLKSLFMVTNW